ncbi:MAG: hypothetical protein H0V22_00855 [Solirubrobacterales bacterium]|nr:hypothetical protein [Solirubrobacterales bacterium]
MSRPARLTLIAIAIFAFIAISLLLARALTATGAERAAVLDVLKAQVRGDGDAVLSDLPDCAREPACAATTRSRAQRLRRPGEVKVLNYRPSVGLSLTRQSGIGRVAWKAGGALPVVQCVRVRREGPLTGGGVTLLSLSDPIGGEAPCGG